MIVTTSCGLCGTVNLVTDVDLWVPATDDEYDTALEIAATLHAIDRHLDDIGPVAA